MKAILPVLVVCLFATLAWADEPFVQRDHDKVATNFARTMVRALNVIERQHDTPKPRAEMAGWAIEGLFAAVKRPMPYAIKEAVAKLPTANPQELEETLRKSRRHLADLSAVEEEDGVAVALKALLAKLSRDTGYVSVRENEGWIICGEGRSAGVGLTIEEDAKSGYLRITTPIVGGPAYKAGLRGGDLIIAIRQYFDRDDEPLDTMVERSTYLMSRDRALELLLGRPGTRISLVVIPG